MRLAVLRLAQAHPLTLRVVEDPTGSEKLARLVGRTRPDVVITGVNQLLELQYLPQQQAVPVVLYSEALLPAGVLREAAKWGVCGQLDQLPTTDPALAVWRQGLLRQLRAARLLPKPLPPAKAPVGHSIPLLPRGVVVIGASTGGTQAVECLVAGLQPSFRHAVVVAVHLPAHFTGSFVERLRRVSALPVVAGQAGTRLVPGQVLVVPGSQHLVVEAAVVNSWPCWQLAATAERSPCPDEPSVDLLMRSVAPLVGRNALGVVLTGLGHDGTLGAQAIREHGGQVVVQDRASAAVFSMPESVIQAGYANDVVALTDLADYIHRTTSRVLLQSAARPVSFSHALIR